jgi:hypothetical protein
MAAGVAGAMEVAMAAACSMTGPPHLGEPYSRMGTMPPPMAATCKTGRSRGPAPASTITAMAAVSVSAGKRGGHWKQLSLLQSEETAADSCPRLHPTNKLVLPECMIIHKKPNKDFFCGHGCHPFIGSFSVSPRGDGPQTASCK